jgi:hypothetical protein
MLRPDADTDQASWDAAQYREAGQHPKVLGNYAARRVA